MGTKFYFPCPACDNNTPQHWKCPECGTDRLINYSGHIGCRQAGKRSGRRRGLFGILIADTQQANIVSPSKCKYKHIGDCRWRCKYHSDSRAYQPKKFGAKLTIVLSELASDVVSGKRTPDEGINSLLCDTCDTQRVCI